MPDLQIQGYPDNLRAFMVTIAAGDSASEMFATQGWAVIGMEIPSGWTAAAIGYKTCISGYPPKLAQVYSAGNTPSITLVTASKNVAFPQQDAIFAPYMQLLSVAAADGTTPVVQVSAVSIVLLLRRLFN